MNTPVDPNPSTPATLFGGEHVTVQYRDPQKSPESVFVREVPISEYNAYLAAINSMTDLVEFVCKRDRGWADTLAPKSLFDLHDRVTALHDPTFAPWFEIMGPILGRLANVAHSRPGASASAAG